MFGGVIVDDSTLLTSSIAGVRAGRERTDGAGVEHGSISNSRCEYASRSLAVACYGQNGTSVVEAGVARCLLVIY